MWGVWGDLGKFYGWLRGAASLASLVTPLLSAAEAVLDVFSSAMA